MTGNHIVILKNRGKGTENDLRQMIAQNKRQIKGSVKDEFGDPVIGVNIMVKNTSTGTITDIDGLFTIAANIGDVLVVKFLGYLTQEITIGAETTYTITMKEDAKTLDEVVVVGYGTTSKRKTTSAISSVKADEIAQTPVPNVTQSLAGRAAGLIVTTSGGGINQTSSISIRGGGSPLYVIDDVISEARDFQNLNPNDIDQISILKDASATAVYGARAGNGIIMVTTKQGKSGKLNVDYNFNYTLSQPAYLPEKLDAYHAAYYLNRGQQSDGLPDLYLPEDLQKYKDGSDPFGHANTDWQDVTMRTFAPEQSHNLSVRGGSENIRIYTGLGYYDQESIYRSNTHSMQRYNVRTNLVANLKEIGLKVTTGIDAYILDLNEPATAGGSGYFTIWSHIQNKKPFEPAYNPYGQIYSGTTDNPLLDISENGGYFKQQRSTVKGNLSLEWSLPWVPGLKLKALGNYTIMNDKNKSWNKTATAYDWEGNPNTPAKSSLSKNTYYYRNFATQFFADYSNTFKEVHTVGATLGIEANGRDFDTNSLSREQYILDVDQIGAGPVNTAKNSSSEGVGSRNAGLIARLKYDYAARYMAEVNMRYDGSDQFPDGNRWGTFFSGSLAWAISEERFWTKLRENHIFDQFKIRVSYGEIGQDSGVGRYAYLPSYNLSERGGYFGGQFVPGFSEGNLVSPDISWYTVKDFNIGFDFASLNSRLSGSVDYFRKATTGYLHTPSGVAYTAPLGKDLPTIKTNGERIRQGFEFVVQWKDKINELEYALSANMTLYDDRYNINPYESEVNQKNPYKRVTQEGSYTTIGYITDGLYKDYYDVYNSPKLTSSTNLVAGDIKYKDFNGDGIIDGEDQVRIGSGSSPRANYGITADLHYKGWFLNMLWQGATSYDIVMGNILQGGNSNYLPVIYEFQTDIWEPGNTNARYPRQHSSAGYNGNNNFSTSDFWLVNAAYIRLKNASVGYDFKHKLLKNVSWLSKCALSLGGYNLLTFSPAKKYGMDPEVGSGSMYAYPISRVYTISLSLGF
ncbi:TonB-dependent receptor [Bacteroides sp. 519]|nr:TonB-dependent receptor [Bacteroides sp. 519]